MAKTTLSDETDWQADSDASTLKKHAEITGDPKRHKAAMGKLQDQHDAVKTALANNQKKMHGKVKKGLAAAFPKDTANDAPTPFQKAGGAGIKGKFTKPSGKSFTEPDSAG